jgi:hypothetical protein
MAQPEKSKVAKFAPWIAVGTLGVIVGLAAVVFALSPKSTAEQTVSSASVSSSNAASSVSSGTTTPAATTLSSDWKSAAKDATKLDAALGTLPRHPIAGGFKPNAVKLEDCKGGDFQCLEQAYGNLTYTEGPKVALARFDADIANPGPIEQNCHRIAHTMGSAALERFKNKIGQAFAAGSSSCWSGYYHGILEHAFQTEKLKEFTSDELARISKKFCDDPDVRATNWIAYQCVHGLGHGLMITTELDLPLALESCNKLANNWDQQSCKGGVFMENISTSYGVESKWIKKDDLLYPCNTIKEGDKLYCYLMVTSYVLRQNGWNWDATAALCAGGEKNWVATCFQSYGRDASGSTRQNAVEILKLCDTAGKHGGQLDCILGASKDMTANYNDGEKAARMCDLAPDEHRHSCYWAIGTISGGFTATADDRLRDCQKYTQDANFVEACRLGANGYPM